MRKEIKIADKETLETLISKVDTLTEKVSNLELTSANTSTLGSLIAIYTLFPSSTTRAGLKIDGKCIISANGILRDDTNSWAVNEINLSQLVVDGIKGSPLHIYNTLTISVNNSIEIEVGTNSNYSVGTVFIYGNKDDISNIDTTGSAFSSWSIL